MSTEKLTKIYDLLFDRFGPQHWWPGQTPFEIIVGAILAQNTNWTNVEKAINNLKRANLLDPDKLHNSNHNRLAELIRPAGYYNIKAKRLKNFLSWLFETYDGNLSQLENLDTDSLRQQLLGINGIGLETADSIVLYAFNKPIFVIDAYTCRIMGRHCLIEPGADYEQVRDIFESFLPSDVKLFNEFHALLVMVGKNFCKPKPKCEGCPLELLPHEIAEYF
ncbi:MAG: endonuclease III domain-containing protein [Sedimentisphaerales bacterium]|nr:endonuclease III domain-containing protein [Sedimentisphaerales bacterium]